MIVKLLWLNLKHKQENREGYKMLLRRYHNHEEKPLDQKVEQKQESEKPKKRKGKKEQQGEE